MFQCRLTTTPAFDVCIQIAIEQNLAAQVYLLVEPITTGSVDPTNNSIGK